jgi:alkanesulfonate monooxygenase SsuD/methylene tetrahydromethanopterin reductase-like flavin-dependent oxidoreductase (luciferase family)
MGDGWHGLRLSPEDVRGALATMDRFSREYDFAVSLRVLTRIGGAVDGVEPATTLHGNAGTIIEQVERYADAGVHHLVIEPFSNDLQDFLEQLQRFAED